MSDKRVFILPGELCVSREPAEIATLRVLRAVCLFNRMYSRGRTIICCRARRPVSPRAQARGLSIDMLSKMLSHDDGMTIGATILGVATVPAP
jgi:hypothetical protein